MIASSLGNANDEDWYTSAHDDQHHHSTHATARQLGAEALGTFLVTAAAAGVDIMYYTHGTVDYTSRWLTRGFVTSVVIYAFSSASGAHANPAVTLAFLLRGVFPKSLTVPYIIAQFTGAFVAAAMWLWLVGPTALRFGASHPGVQFGPGIAAAAEVVATFALILTILMTAQDEPAIGPDAALAVGFMVATCGFVAGPISGASMNPARTIPPQVLAGTFYNSWVYVIGPLIGTIAAVGAHALVSGAPSKGERKAARGKQER